MNSILFKIWLILLPLLATNAFGQNSFTLSTPLIFSKVTVKENWMPSTSANKKEYLNGSTLGYGVNLNYSFHPSFILNSNKIYLNAGIGYFSQRFDILRPFSYVSPNQPVFFTDHYTYQCLQSLLGISYHYKFKSRFSLTSDLTYSWLYSFRQAYKPTIINPLYGWDTQINKNRINFGNILLLSVGLHRDVGNRISTGFNLMLPLKTLWRNDTIFRDDPNEFLSPDSSLGISLSIRYRILLE